MIVKTNLIPHPFEAVTCWPFIFVKPPFEENKALMAHEQVHYEEQRETFLIPWFLAYWLSKNFRLRAEARGYAVQISMDGIDFDSAVRMLLNYKLGMTLQQIEAVLREAQLDLVIKNSLKANEE